MSNAAMLLKVFLRSLNVLPFKCYLNFTMCDVVTRDNPQRLRNEFPVKFEFPTLIN